MKRRRKGVNENKDNIEKELRIQISKLRNEVKLDTRQRNIVKLRFNLMMKGFDEEETQKGDDR